MTIGVDQVRQLAVVLRDGLRQVHRLSGGGAFVEQGRVGDLESGQIRHHRLEVEQRLQPPLGDLRLVGRVGRIPAGILEYVPLNHRGREAVVVPHAQVGAKHLILRGEQSQRFERLLLGPRFGSAQRLAQPDVRRHDRVDECVERVVPERLKHRALVN